jgi:hypothetical protein
MLPHAHVQALYPWRRVLREMFLHDRQLGQLYCTRDPVVVSQLAATPLPCTPRSGCHVGAAAVCKQGRPLLLCGQPWAEVHPLRRW